MRKSKRERVEDRATQGRTGGGDLICGQVPAYMHACMPAYMHACMHTCIHAYMHTYSGNVSHSTQLVQHIYQARHMRRVIQHDTTLSAIRIDERWKRARTKLSLHLLCLSRSPLFRILATLSGQAIRSACAQRPWLCFQPFPLGDEGSDFGRHLVTLRLQLQQSPDIKALVRRFCVD